MQYAHAIHAKDAKHEMHSINATHVTRVTHVTPAINVNLSMMPTTEGEAHVKLISLRFFIY